MDQRQSELRVLHFVITISIIAQVVSTIVFLIGPKSETLKVACFITSVVTGVLIWHNRGRRVIWGCPAYCAFSVAIMFFVMGFGSTLQPIQGGVIHKFGQSVEAAVVVGLISATVFGVAGSICGLLIAIFEKTIANR